METIHMLTTFDNPFNPFVDFSSWYMFDCEMQHNTCGRLARLVELDSEMTEKEVMTEKERVMDFIIQHDLEGIFFKGTEEQIESWLKCRDKSYKSKDTQTATATNA